VAPWICDLSAAQPGLRPLRWRLKAPSRGPCTGPLRGPQQDI